MPPFRCSIDCIIFFINLQENTNLNYNEGISVSRPVIFSTMQQSVPPRYRWQLLALLFCAYFFHQADRAIFGIVLPSIKGELNLTDTQLGWSATILFLITALMVPVAGFLGDRWSKKWIITISIIFWSIATSLTGTAKGLWGIIAFRSVATSGSESFYGPASTALIAAYHQKTRAIALSIHQASLYFGIMISGFLAGWIADMFGWRSAFYLFGCCGILLGISFIFLLRDAPKTAPSAKVPQEKPLPPFEAIKRIVRIPTALLLTVGFTAIVFVNNAYLTWSPAFIKAKFDLSQTEAGGYTMLYHHLAALCGVLLGGMLADYLVPKFPRFRLLLQTTAMFLGAPMIFCFGWLPSLTLVWTATFLFGFLRGLYESNTHAAMFDVIPAQLRSTVVGLMIMTAFLIGSLSPLLLGYLSDQYPDEGLGLTYGFSILSMAWVIGGLCLLTALCFTFKKDKRG
ncbi:MAG: MFS transporter [Planctomycetaceae bacterium]|jgi:MFS family permease|nr:MFS transporter [Planctomycetaceae bacterium]